MVKNNFGWGKGMCHKFMNMMFPDSVVYKPPELHTKKYNIPQVAKRC